jgi:creatinine amidohydrolase/Fe(II)-dependent formamide hydrolase-like protein
VRISYNNSLFIFVINRLLQWLICSLVLSSSVWADEINAVVKPVQLEALTSTEVQAALAAGVSTILIPIGATEQTGPYVALGKHNLRVRALAEQIARQLGHALVAPVVSYTPDGVIHPPTSHMRFAGTISIPEATFEALLEGAARSFKQHGFRYIILLGDHGGYQRNLARVAQKLNREWANGPSARVIHLAQYYRLSFTEFNALLKKRGYSDAEIGVHGGLTDTALTMAVDKKNVRSQAMAASPKPTEREGVVGDPRRASAELGELGVQLIVEGSVAAIRDAIKRGS